MFYSDWENYKGLPSEQEEDFYQFFCEYISIRDMDYFVAMEHFKPGSDTLVEFLESLENNFEWFDYTQMDEIFQELSLYILQLLEDEEDRII